MFKSLHSGVDKTSIKHAWLEHDRKSNMIGALIFRTTSIQLQHTNSPSHVSRAAPVGVLSAAVTHPIRTAAELQTQNPNALDSSRADSPTSSRRW